MSYVLSLSLSLSLSHAHTHTHMHSFFNIAKLFYSYAILSSFLLQFYVPMDFLEPPLYDKMRLDQLMYYFPRHHNKVRFFVQILFRTLLVLFTG